MAWKYTDLKTKEQKTFKSKSEAVKYIQGFYKYKIEHITPKKRGKSEAENLEEEE